MSSPPAPRPPAPILPEPERAREWLATMMLIRRFEERAGEMYARAKVGGHRHVMRAEQAHVLLLLDQGNVQPVQAGTRHHTYIKGHGLALAR